MSATMRIKVTHDDGVVAEYDVTEIEIPAWSAPTIEPSGNYALVVRPSPFS